MKYKIGDKFYTIKNNRLYELTIEEICYKFKGGKINSNEYLSDSKLATEIKNKNVFVDKSEYNKSQILLRQTKILQLQKEIDELGEL